MDSQGVPGQVTHPLRSSRLSKPPETPCAVYPLCVTSSDGSDVLVEQPTEAIKTLHRAVSNRYRVGPFAGPALPEALVWPRLGYVTFGEEEKVWP